RCAQRLDEPAGLGGVSLGQCVRQREGSLILGNEFGGVRNQVAQHRFAFLGAILHEIKLSQRILGERTDLFVAGIGHFLVALLCFAEFTLVNGERAQIVNGDQPLVAAGVLGGHFGESLGGGLLLFGQCGAAV